MDEYKDYTYKRFRKPRRFFLVVMLLLSVVAVVFSLNLIFGFISFGGGGGSRNTLELQGMTFYTLTSDEFTDKADAMEHAINIRADGGAAFLRASGEAWQVIERVSNKEFENSVAQVITPTSITLINQEHRELVSNLASTFITTLQELSDFYDRYSVNLVTQREISDKARIAYNNLIDLTASFQEVMKISTNAAYEKIFVALISQLLGLNVVWLEVNNQNFAHVLQNAMSWVAFAYVDLLNSVAQAA